MNPVFEAALRAAAKELVEDYDWTLTDDGASGIPPDDCQMFRILRKHLAPLCADGWIASRRASLTAELAALDALEQPE